MTHPQLVHFEPVAGPTASAFCRLVTRKHGVRSVSAACDDADGRPLKALAEFDYAKVELCVPVIADELHGADFGDRRLSNRLALIGEVLARAPWKSFPQAAVAAADLQALYRFLGNERVEPGAILQPHFVRTVERCARIKKVLVAHDSTHFKFTDREGLGRLRADKDLGFFAHISIAINADPTRQPLGVLGFKTWARPKHKRRKTSTGRKKSAADYAKLTDKESSRWLQQIRAVAEQVGDQAQVVHIMDREADYFWLIAELQQPGCAQSFVIRLTHDRNARQDDTMPWEKVRQIVGRAEDVCQVEVPISSRKASKIPGKRKTFPARQGRMARLRYAATRIELKCPKYLTQYPKTIAVNVVRAYEVDVPDGLEPVEWLLLTTEPIDTPEQVRLVVEYYRARWLIEEFNKALKTGCAAEQRQLQDYEALCNAIAIFLPIAWQMLLLRTLAAQNPNAPAECVLEPEQIEVLRAFGPEKLPEHPTVGQALLAVARLGGFIHQRNRKPGWQTLGRGMQELVSLTAGWVAGWKAREKCLGPSA